MPLQSQSVPQMHPDHPVCAEEGIKNLQLGMMDLRQRCALSRAMLGTVLRPNNCDVRGQRLYDVIFAEGLIVE